LPQAAEGLLGSPFDQLFHILSCQACVLVLVCIG
jgi:hypothetical protein